MQNNVDKFLRPAVLVFVVVISYHLISFVTISLEKIICWPLNGGKNRINNTLATAKRWPRPLNGGGR